jgi:sugar lactone lactonase YvrE
MKTPLHGLAGAAVAWGWLRIGIIAAVFDFMKIGTGWLSLCAMACTGMIAFMSPNARAQNLFVSDGANVYEFTPNGTRSTFATLSGGASGLAFSSAGDLFVCDSVNYNIYKFTPDGTQTTFASVQHEPDCLAFDSGGNLFLGTLGWLYEFAPNGTNTTFALGLSEVSGLAFDDAGNLFEADGSSGYINKFAPDGTKTIFTTLTNGFFPVFPVFHLV